MSSTLAPLQPDSPQRHDKSHATSTTPYTGLLTPYIMLSHMNDENQVNLDVSSLFDVSLKTLCSEPFSAITVDWTSGCGTSGIDSAGVSWRLWLLLHTSTQVTQLSLQHYNHVISNMNPQWQCPWSTNVREPLTAATVASYRRQDFVSGEGGTGLASWKDRK